jgi:two-component sensor histidine kinase
MLIKFLKINILCLLFLGLLHNICASKLTHTNISNVKKIYPITKNIESLNGNYDAVQVLNHLQDFKLHQDENLVVGVQETNVQWFRFTVLNKTEREVYLKMPNLRYGKVLLYEFTNNQLILLDSGGNDMISGKEKIRSNQDIFPLFLKQSEFKTFYLKINRFERKVFWAEIGTDFAIFSESHKNDILEGIFYGCLLIVVIFQFVIYYVTKQKDYLWLAIYLLVLLIQTISMTGIIFEFFTINADAYPFYISVLPVTSFFSFIFTYHFLNLSIYQKTFFRYVVYLFLIGFLLTFLFGTTGNVTLAFNIVWIAFLNSIAFVYIGFRRLREGFKPAAYYLFAYLPTCFVILLRIFYILGIVGYSWFTENSLLIGFAFHALAFSVAVAYKIKTYRDETELLILEQRDDLEQKVAERTYELGKEKAVIEEQSEKLKMVMKELHHRVKNNLTIVSSLLELQSNRLHDETTIKAFQEGQQRIEAMSLIHQRLYKSEQLTTINMVEYIEELSHNLMNAYGFIEKDIEIITNIEYQELDIDVAIPIGLILNELLTNTFKYAFKNTKSPQLIINLLKIKGLVLEVKDNGIGIDMEQWRKKTGSFGKRLIMGLGEQLGGECTIENNNGTIYQLYIAE